jgi:hypothetical protein
MALEDFELDVQLTEETEEQNSETDFDPDWTFVRTCSGFYCPSDCC